MNHESQIQRVIPYRASFIHFKMFVILVIVSCKIYCSLQEMALLQPLKQSINIKKCYVWHTYKQMCRPRYRSFFLIWITHSNHSLKHDLNQNFPIKNAHDWSNHNQNHQSYFAVLTSILEAIYWYVYSIVRKIDANYL